MISGLLSHGLLYCEVIAGLVQIEYPVFFLRKPDDILLYA